MVGLISIVILFLSLIGMAVILLRKMPDLCKLPEKNIAFGNNLTNGFKNGVKKLPGVKNFSYELYLQKLLSRIRIITLKTESKTGNWLERLRQKNCQKNQVNHNGYWDALKKAKDDR